MPGCHRHDIVVPSKEVLVKKLIGPGGVHTKALASRTGALFYCIDHEPLTTYH